MSMLQTFSAAICAFIIFKNVFGEDTGTSPCIGQSTYSISGVQSVAIELGYDPGVNLDTGFIKAMCKAAKMFPTVVTLSFVPGYFIFVKDGKTLCTNEGDDRSCTHAIEHACASKLVDDFASFVCCTIEDGMTPAKCVGKQNKDKLEEYKKCFELKDSCIDPLNILVENSNYSTAKHPTDYLIAPMLDFNKIFDNCARYNLYDNPKQVICAMLAAGVDKQCSG